MNADVSGIWEGTLHTHTAKDTAVYNSYSGPLEIRERLGGGPPQIFNVKLSIASQSEYTHFGAGYFGEFRPRVSIISGHLYGYDQSFYLTPVSGFVDDAGLVTLSFLSPHYEAWTFSGRLTVRGWRGGISGNWTQTSSSPPTWVIQEFGTLSVTKLGLWLDLSDRAYLVPLGRSF